VWRDFDWSAIVPTIAGDGGTFPPTAGPSLQFSFATAPTQAELGILTDAGGPAVASTSIDYASGSYFTDVQSMLGNDAKRTWLRVSMTLNPDVNHQIAPILASWAQQYDCVPSQ
jgi:hypothetical protein